MHIHGPADRKLWKLWVLSGPTGKSYDVGLGMLSGGRAIISCTFEVKVSMKPEKELGIPVPSQEFPYIGFMECRIQA